MALNTVVLVAAGAPYNVSTITPLVSALDVRFFKKIMVSLQNPDGANLVSLFVDPGTKSGKFDTNRRLAAVAQPLEEGHVEIVEFLYPTIRALAQTDSPFPVVSGVTFEVRGECLDSGVYDLLVRTGVGVPA